TARVMAGNARVGQPPCVAWSVVVSRRAPAPSYAMTNALVPLTRVNPPRRVCARARRRPVIVASVPELWKRHSGIPKDPASTSATTDGCGLALPRQMSPSAAAVIALTTRSCRPRHVLAFVEVRRTGRDEKSAARGERLQPQFQNELTGGRSAIR